MNNLIKRHPGVSLLITVLFTATFLLVVIGVGQATFFSLREIRDFTRYDQTLELSRGASDYLQLVSEKQMDNEDTLGEEQTYLETECDSDSTYTNSSLSEIICGLAVSRLGPPIPVLSYDLLARPDYQFTFGGSSEWYSSPLAFVEDDVIRGTGNVSSDCGDTPEDPDALCHWNTITPGETVEIPLFYYDESDNPPTLQNISGPPTTVEFRLRVRTPDSQTLYLSPTQPVGHWRYDPTLLGWQIISESNTLQPRQDLLPDGVRDANNTEIFASRINNARSSDSILLDESSQGENDDGDMVSLATFLNDLLATDEPYIQLQLAGIPKKETWAPVRSSDPLASRRDALENLLPYFEYQILITREISDDKRIARSTVTMGNIEQTYEKQVYLETSSAPISIEDL